MNTALARAVLGGKWLLDYQSADAFMPILASVLRGDAVEEKELSPKLQIYTAEHGIAPGYYSGFTKEDIPYGSIAIIPVKGAIMKEDGPCGEAGTVTLAKWVEQANANRNIAAILLDIDSPGGQVDGTQTLAQAIKGSEKKTLALVNDGMACSAGLWIASAADEVWISQSTSVMGSLGVYVTFADIKAYYEAQGLKIHEVYADQSSSKNKDFKEALKGNYSAIKEGMLNPIANQFQATMLEYRAGKIAATGEHMEGKTYMGQACIDIGFADKMGSMDEAIAHLSQLATTSNQNQFFNNNSQTQMKFKTEWEAFKANLGFDNASSEEEMPLITEERLEQLNGSLEAANSTVVEREATIAQLQAELTTAQGENATLTATVDALTTERDSLTAEVAKLGKGAGDTHTNTKGKGTEGDDTHVLSEQEQFESFDHNKKALEELKNIA